MGAGRYLYLLWDDYVSSGGISANQALEIAKVKIMQRFNALQAANPIVAEDKQMIKDAYSLSNESFKSFMEHNLSQVNTEYGKMLTDIDQAVATLDTMKQEAPQAQTCYNEIVKIISLLDDVINAGNISEGITDGSVQQIKRIADKAKQLASRIKMGGSMKRTIGKSIIGQLDELQAGLAKTVAGYALEEFLSLSYINSHTFGYTQYSKDIKQSFINSGAKVTSSNLDSKYEQLLKKELSDLNGKQAKADTVKFFDMNPKTGQGSGKLEIMAETVQAKNYTDISRISLGNTFTEHTLGFLNFQGDSIFDYYDEIFLLNAAASLGNNIQTTESELKTIIEEHNPSTEQNMLAENWNKIVKQASILSAIDAIAGKGILNSAKYYVIRQKGTGQVRVIASAEIVQKIKMNPEGVINTEGLNTGQNYSKRYDFSDINKIAFLPGDRNENKIKRSSNIWEQVRNAIQNTKIKISLNAMSWFA